MRTNRVKQLLKSGNPTVGSMLNSGSPLIAEILAHAGFDWLIVDLEHSENDLANLQAMLQAISTTATIPFVRLPAQDVVFIKRSLDLGAYGIVVPQVESVMEAEAVVKATRYPPIGRRSWGTPRGLLYGGPDYFTRAADEIMVVAMLETAAGVQNARQIMAVEGVDACFVGPNDLSISLGHSPEATPLSPEVERAIEAIKSGAEAEGKAAGIQTYTATALNERLRQGFTFVGLSTDIRFLSTAAKSAVSEVKRIGIPSI
jgi:4-hydroxy-2-oxoheptanedioate aldolase